MEVLKHNHSEEVKTFLGANGLSMTPRRVWAVWRKIYKNGNGRKCYKSISSNWNPLNRRLLRDTYEDATVQMDSATENRVQLGNSRSRKQESPSVAGHSSSFFLFPKDMLSPPPGAVDVTSKCGRPKGTSNVITSSPFRNRLLQSKRNYTSSRLVSGDKSKASIEKSWKLTETKPYFKKIEDNDGVKCVFYDGDFPIDTFGEEWTPCLTCDDWGQEECSEVRNKFHSISNNKPTMTALIPIYIHLFGFTLPDAFRCFLCTPSSGASTCFHSHGYYDPLQHHACSCFPGCLIVVTCTPYRTFH
jgi:hypothetical protein